MKIVTCYKVVPEDQDIAINSDHTLKLDSAEAKISPYDLNAVEAAVQIKESIPESTVVGISVGGKKYLENQKVRKDILSRGPDSLTLVIDDGFAGLLPMETATVLAAAIEKEGFDLVLCGEGSGDLYAQQVGTLLGQRLGVSTINAVSKITVNDGVAVVERSLDDEVETLEITLPAVLSVTSDINVPRLPSMKAILAAGKKPTTTLSAADVNGAALAPVSLMTSVTAPEQRDRRREIIANDSEESIKAFIELVKKAIN